MPVIEPFFLPIPVFVPIPVWCHPPAYVAPPARNVIFNGMLGDQPLPLQGRR